MLFNNYEPMALLCTFCSNQFKKNFCCVIWLIKLTHEYYFIQTKCGCELGSQHTSFLCEAFLQFMPTDLETCMNVRLFLIYHIPFGLFIFVKSWIHRPPPLTSYDACALVGTLLVGIYKWTSQCIFFKFSYERFNYENLLLNHIPYCKSN
jgi:hypothetical protein